MTGTTPTICLCMIVKNEAGVIRRCLDSVRPLISHWVIVDTGSSDGTQDIIRAHLHDVPGELHERPWQDFAHNRSEALALARDKAQFSLVIDADDALELPPGFQLPELEADSYLVEIRDPPVLYWRKQLVNNRLHWFYRGVLHEFMTSTEPHSTGILPIGMRRNHDGARRKDPSWFEKDVALLARTLETETDPYLRSRYTFYLAQSYRDSRKPAQALTHYQARSKLGGWQEEVFVSLYQSARLMEELGYPQPEVLAAYQAAIESHPARIEARHGAARYCRLKGLNAQGYDFAKGGLGRPLPEDALFAETWIYDYGLADEYAVNAYWVGRHEEALGECLRLLANGKLPAADQARVSANAKASWEVLAKSLTPARLGSAAATDFVDQHALTPARRLRTRLAAPPRVLVAILAKQKEAVLPLYLQCIEDLDYPKSEIVLYIRTNNNTDNTEAVLRDWVAKVGHLYAGVDFDAADVAVPVQNFGVHEWNAARFAVLGEIRNASLRRTAERGCAFYFVSDVDNFVRPETLRELVALDLPIASPFLRSLARERFYSNYHAEVDQNGYYEEVDQYHWILKRHMRGVIEVPVVHCTYLVRADVVPELTYTDGTTRHEYVIFSDSARRAAIPQYIDNRQVYGYISFADGNPGHVPDGGELARRLLGVVHGTR